MKQGSPLLLIGGITVRQGLRIEIKPACSIIPPKIRLLLPGIKSATGDGY